MSTPGTATVTCGPQLLNEALLLGFLWSLAATAITFSSRAGKATDDAPELPAAATMTTP
jgi:hypothetical protein